MLSEIKDTCMKEYLRVISNSKPFKRLSINRKITKSKCNVYSMVYNRIFKKIMITKTI